MIPRTNENPLEGGGGGGGEAGGIVVVVTSAPTHEVPQRQTVWVPGGREGKKEERRDTSDREQEERKLSVSA